MHVAILIKVLLEINLSDFMFTACGSNDSVIFDEFEIILSALKPIFSRHQYLINHFVKIYKATLNLVKLVSKI